MTRTIDTSRSSSRTPRRGLRALALAAAAALPLALGVATAPAAMAASPAPSGWARVAHLSPDTKTVDVQLTALAGGAVVYELDDVAYGAVSPYIPLAEGTMATTTTTPNPSCGNPSTCRRACPSPSPPTGATPT